MSTLIYDPDMTISVLDQSIPEPESDTPALDTALSAVFAGFTSKGKHNVIYEAKSPADLLNEYGDDFANFAKYGPTNLTALGFARSGGRTFFCSLIPEDAKRAYSVFGVTVIKKSDIPVYERSDTKYNEDRTDYISLGTGAFVLDKSGNKVPVKVKESSADDTPTKVVTVEGVELRVETKKLEDTITNFNSDGEPLNFSGEPIVTSTEHGEEKFYPLFTTFYYSNGKGGNDYAYRIERDTGRDKKLTDGRRYTIEFFKLLSTGSWAELYDEPFYFSFNPESKYSDDSDITEGLSSVYLNEDSDGNSLPLQMKVYDENFAKLVEALNPYKGEGESIYDIDFLNCIYKNGNPYTQIVKAPTSIDVSNTMITLDNGTDGSIDVGATVNGEVITEEKAAQVKEDLLVKFFSCDIDDNIFDEKITDIDYLFDTGYSIDVKKIILGTFHQYRPDIKLKMVTGEASNYTEGINQYNELAPYIYSKYNFMVSFAPHYGTLTDPSVGSPFRVPYTYDFARSEADNFASVGGAFQMHAGATRGKVKYFRPDWVAKKNKTGMLEKLRELNINYVEVLDKQGTKMWGTESSQYHISESKLASDRNTLVIGRAMRICHSILPYFKYDERDIETTLKAAASSCMDALESSNLPTTIGITVSLYQTKQDKRTENAHCDIIFTFPDYAKTYTVTIIAKRPEVEA